ncbi:hypothetical protein Cgig2_008912 [Carnegiea gigantea]|uniref:Trafficking protein particle complex subunit 8 n=1 Tax=Carnegiea gigantea TaxID=171969 RepID=A0A9Q1GW47_9CARY|nr:hypothetical protein Cgig2_008912 [Carnegiea gigantea]
MDPKILKHYIILHDNQDGPPDKASKILQDMKSTFGSNDCQLLCINSSQDRAVEIEDDPWSSWGLDSSPAKHLGGFLSTEDIDEMKVLMNDLTTKHIIPHMEQKIRVLNQQVSATRKGFRNQIKNLWWRKGKDDTPDTPDGPAYTFSSIESQIRILGDYAFMLRDYDLALSNYRLISTDYKLDKAWKRYAGVQEMMALTYFMLDQSRKDAEYCMETAFSTYIKLGLRGQQNAIRCGLWWAEMLKAREEYKEAAGVYFRVSGEEPLVSAVMLEQASYCYLFSVPLMLRKYGFHLILSGDSYKKCDQTKHAIRTYKAALYVFKGTSWGLIRDHIHFQLGKWFAFLGMFDVAIEHMLEILACTHQSKAAQELFLGDFLELVQKTGKTFEVCRLRLPVVRLPSLRVVFEDHRTYASPAAVSVKESLWRSLEEEIIPSLSAAKTNWLEMHTKLVSKEYKESNMCVAGEAIKVDIGFRNPLQIPISVSNVSLVCMHFVKTEEMQSSMWKAYTFNIVNLFSPFLFLLIADLSHLLILADEISSSTNLQNDEHLRKLIAGGEVDADNCPFMLSEVDFSLSGGETLVVQLTVTPKVEGMLKLVGVRWKLSGSVVGFQTFDSGQVKKRNARRAKPKQSHGNELKFLSLPRLEGSINYLPKRSYLGELHRLVLELKNQSEFPVKNLKMKISHPRFLILGSPEALDSEFPACLRKENSEKHGDAACCDERPSFFEFPEDLVIQGKEPVLWPLWFRAALPGSISLHITIYYEVGDVSVVMRYRTLRMSYNFENGRKSTISEEDVISNVGSRGSDVRLDAQVDNEDLFDVSRSPVADFHHYERLQEGTSDQSHSGTVDFILISHPRKSGPSTEFTDHSRLFSHHACHCSVASGGPLYWLMDGPRTIYHDFFSSFCEINMSLRIHNSLDAPISVRVNTGDSSPSTSHSGHPSGVASENQTGWHDISLSNEIKVTSDPLGITRSVRQLPANSVGPYVWCGSSSTKVQLAPLSTVEVPVQLSVFTPGTYDISNYQLHWELLQSESEARDADSRPSSGTYPGQSFYLTVLQST